MSPRIAVPLARVRATAVAVVIGLQFVQAWLQVLPVPWIVTWLAAVSLIVLLVRAGTLHRDPVDLQAPVRGRWQAYNSPSSRVPSHGVQSYGQAYAIDLVAEPAESNRPGFGWWPPARRPGDYPGFGQTIFAPCDGTIVRLHDRERDHYSRTSPLGLLYMFTVELFREVFGPSRILGNHIVIDNGDRTWTVLAHLRRGSIQVRPGQRVTAGDPVAQCGNSGNSSEPHLHLQVMDHPRPALAAGVPFRLVPSEGSPLPTPPTGAHLSVAATPSRRSSC